jgi:YidC/Oxa1 family membrane protein insertase
MRFIVGLAAAATLLLLLTSSFAVAQVSPSPSLTPTAQPSTEASATPVSSVAATPGPSPDVSPGASTAPCPLQTPLPTPPAPGATPPPHALCPAVPGDPISTLAFLFNPIFQTLFLAMATFYVLIGDIGIAIILLTLVIKTVLIPLFRRQIVSQRRMQMLQPEIKAIQQKFKGNRTKISEETMRLYRDRGVNPAAGCLPTVLQLFLLIPIYSVISQGLSATDVSSAMQFLGQPVLNLMCQHPGTLQPCIDPMIHWLGVDAHVPEVLVRLSLPFFPNFGLSGLALVAAFLQLVQTRMMTPSTTDPQQASQQRIFLFLPLISIFYGAILPAGLFIYWIVFTAYSVIQQYLIVGWGSLFPLFGWTPGFAKDHTPRFPVAMPAAVRAQSGDDRDNTDPRPSPSDRAAGTIRPARQKPRTSRRGRRR